MAHLRSLAVWDGGKQNEHAIRLQLCHREHDLAERALSESRYDGTSVITFPLTRDVFAVRDTIGNRALLLIINGTTDYN